MRPVPTIAPPELRRKASERIVQERRYELLTPLFGGGVSPAQADPVTTLRGPGIRGQLRFWWRATRGGQFNGSLEAMKSREQELWGAASTTDGPGPSQVQIALLEVKPGTPDNPYEVVPRGPGDSRPKIRAREKSLAPAYAAFPLQPQEKEAVINMKTKEVRNGVAFTLRISFSATDRPDVEAALWAWETFGGVGARTRRGFGALKLKDLKEAGSRPVLMLEFKTLPNDAPSGVEQVRPWLKASLEKHVLEGRCPEGVPHLSRTLRYRLVQPHPKGAWNQLIERLKSFRQQRNPGNQPNRPGRSRWPEPDTLRELTRCSAPHHSRPLTSVRKFPRAAFGLPIIFHFKDNGEPGDTTLKGAKAERLASPLILRPLACGNQVAGLAAILECSSGLPDGIVPGGLVAEVKPVQGARDLASFRVQSIVTAAEARAIPPLGGKTDVLQAFLDSLT